MGGRVAGGQGGGGGEGGPRPLRRCLAQRTSATSALAPAEAWATVKGCCRLRAVVLPSSERSTPSTALARGVRGVDGREEEEAAPPKADDGAAASPRGEPANDDEAEAKEEPPGEALELDEAIGVLLPARLPEWLPPPPKCWSCLGANCAREYCSSRHTEWWAS
jgi:hypothetical protein